jgi:hypothetical protein
MYDVSAHPLNESAKSPADKSESMVGTTRAAFIIPVTDVFICSFNYNDANKQSQIKINFVATPSLATPGLCKGGER